MQLHPIKIYLDLPRPNDITVTNLYITIIVTKFNIFSITLSTNVTFLHSFRIMIANL